MCNLKDKALQQQWYCCQLVCLAWGNFFFQFCNIVAQYFSEKWQQVKSKNHDSHKNPFLNFPHYQSSLFSKNKPNFFLALLIIRSDDELKKCLFPLDNTYRRGATKNFSKVRPPYLSRAPPQPLPHSILQNQGKTEVLSFLPLMAPLNYVVSWPARTNYMKGF